MSTSNIRVPSSFPHSPLDANGSNYTSWVTSMDLWLSLFNLWRLITGDEKGPQPPIKGPTESNADFAQRLATYDPPVKGPTESNADFAQRLATHDASVDVTSFHKCQSIAKGLLGMAVHSSDLIHFTGVTNPALIWKALEDKYQATVGIRFTCLMGRVFDLPKASDSESLTTTVKEITDIKAQFKEIMDIKAQFKVIESVEWKCNEYTLVQALLRALPDFYAPLWQLILHSMDVNAGKLMLEGVISQIWNSEQYYASFGSDNPHAHHTAMATRTAKPGQPLACPKLKELNISKGDSAWDISGTIAVLAL
ncbi:hypothetical protein AZE42_11265 [Rhizopogon vesiculosus]|uniref:DUF4219 domain-containing protein n=1 Tax=Rhizopogon vesiculosus TaxID=180088 RepID=A0A1J8PKT6_9AGAM|nr:hypothetical protein AZE42_11265 [Rhizopogon vesiculosus]